MSEDLAYLRGNFASISNGLNQAIAALNASNTDVVMALIVAAKYLSDSSVVLMDKQRANMVRDPG